MKKTGIAILAAVLALLSAITAVAVFYGNAHSRTGSVISEKANRVNFTFENTEQVFSAEDGNYMAEIVFTAEKTEADFYAVIHAVTLEGMEYEKLEILPADDREGNVPLFDAVLPVEDGKAAPMSWKIRIYFSADPGTELAPVLCVDYESGVKKEAADRRVFEAALSLKVED